LGRNRSRLSAPSELPAQVAPQADAHHPKTSSYRRPASTGPRIFYARFIALPGVEASEAFARCSKLPCGHYGLRAIDLRETNETGSPTMSAYSEKIAKQKTGTFKVADFEPNKEITLTISDLLEDVPMFDKEVDLLCFQETGRQLQMNITNAEFLIDKFGDDPEKWNGKRVTLGLAPYGRENKLGIRVKLPGTSGDGAAAFGQNRGAPSSAPAPMQTDPSASLDDEIPF
jgi:hypothetical protein